MLNQLSAPSAPLVTVHSPLDALAAELGATAARIERDLRRDFAVGMAEMRQELAVGRAEARQELETVRRYSAEFEARAVSAEMRIAAAEWALAESVRERLATVRDGEMGPAGPQGERGLQGERGEIGPQGEVGPQGEHGEIGPQGDVGPIGPPGNPGPQGERGDTGPEGEAGLQGEIGPAGPQGETGSQGEVGLQGERGDAGPQGDAGLIGPQGERGDPGQDGVTGPQGDPGLQGERGLQGDLGLQGERGPEGPPGKLVVVRAWQDAVHYEADVVTHAGATWQALRDTAREPPHEDWICLAAPGQEGPPGRTFTIRGTYESNQNYSALNIVALNGGSFIARYDDPGPCPGDGWQLMAMQGKTGKPGERGPSGNGVSNANIDNDGLLTLTNGDGSSVSCDLYPLLSKISN